MYTEFTKDYNHKVMSFGKYLFRSLLSTYGDGQEQGRGGKALPRDAQVVVCGGGVVGASVAYHLPKCGYTDVILLEQGRYMKL